MTFALHVDAVPFRAHLASVRDEVQKLGAQLTPVIKGNGYGFGRQILTKESMLLGLPRIAVGTVWELEQALAQFNGEVLVLEPFNAEDHLAISQWQAATASHEHRILATIAADNLLAAFNLGIRNVMLDAKTSLTRFGLATHELIHLTQSIPAQMRVHGLILHLPISDSPRASEPGLISGTTGYTAEASGIYALAGRELETHAWLLTYRELAREHELPLHVSLSHVSASELAQLMKQFPDFSFELRLGTSLWLGAPSSLSVTGQVLAVHNVRKNQHIGYRQIQSESNQRLAVISGGTAHGVALAAPSARVSLRAKTIALVEGLSEARGKVRSPFSTAGKNLIFAEPPHMHVSLLWCGDSALQVGDQVTCNVRNTTAQFDVVTGLN